MFPKFYLFKRIKDAKIIIDRNYYENSLDLDQIAKRVYLSKFHFLRLFKKAYSLSPHKYLQLKRIEAAKKKLHTKKSISRISNEVGYESIYSFSHAFKKHMGMSPTNFRLQLRKQKK